MEFEWDEVKRLENIKKHKFDFVSAPQLFLRDHTRKRARVTARTARNAG